MTLTNMACNNAKPRPKSYKIFDGGGLYLEIMPNASKLWRLKYRFVKEKRISFGPYPLVSLAEAREMRDGAKKLLIRGIDPAANREEKKQQTIRDAGNAFQVVALEWFDKQLGKWSDGYAKKVKQCLERNVFPYIGRRPIHLITPNEMMESVFDKIEKRGALDTTRRTRHLCDEIFRYGVRTQKCDRDPVRDLKGAFKSRKVQHFKTIEAKDLPKFLKALERNDARLFAQTRRALKFSLLTFLRPGEVRKAQWSEIDYKESELVIDASKMKRKRDHIVPLSRQALAILKEQHEETAYLNSDWIFPGRNSRKNCMSDGTVNLAIKRLGFGKQLVAHGLRALARTVIREKLKFDSEIIERQLAHKTSNPLGEAYDRTEFLEERKVMMQKWADYLDKQLSDTI
jgi:integrase